MKLYRVSAVSQENPHDRHFAEWTGTQAGCGKLRATLTGNGVPKKDILTREYEVPTNKEGLIAFLNLVESDDLDSLNNPPAT